MTPTFGTRVIRVNIKAIVGLMRWPFPPGTTVHVEANKLPDDCTFVAIERMEPPYVYVRVASQRWVGETDELVEPARFRYMKEGRTIALPDLKNVLGGLRH